VAPRDGNDDNNTDGTADGRSGPARAGGDHRPRTRWSRWGGWLVGALAVAANAVGVIEVATANRVLLAPLAGVLAIVGGGVWLWRLSESGYSARARRWTAAASLAMVIVGAGLVGYVLAGSGWDEAQGRERAGEPPHARPGPAWNASPDPAWSASPDPAWSASPGTRGTPPTAASPAPPAADPQPGGPAARRPGATAGGSTRGDAHAATVAPRVVAGGRFTGSITIRQPEFGRTLAPGQDLRGDVTGWTTGHQVWMSARAEGSGDELVQGPCRVDAARFVCSAVQLPGGPGTHEYIIVAVVTDAVAARLADSGGLSTVDTAAADQTQIYRG
jgi:hypothetical protein